MTPCLTCCTVGSHRTDQKKGVDWHPDENLPQEIGNTATRIRRGGEVEKIRTGLVARERTRISVSGGEDKISDGPTRGWSLQFNSSPCSRERPRRREDQWEEADAAVTRIDTVYAPQDLNVLFKLTLLYNPLPSGSANTIRTSCFTDFRKLPIPEMVPPVPAKVWGLA